MHVLSRLTRSIGLQATLACVFLLLSAASHAEGFSIKDASASFSQNALSVEATFDLQLSEAVDEALHNGVDIQLLTTLDLFTRRAYVWDKRIARWAFTQQIRFHTLTNRYILASPQLEESKSFSTLGDLLDEISQFSFQSDIMSETLPESKNGYKLQLRIALDNSVLPAPLRVMKFISPAWKLRSDVHEWPVESSG